jgi:cytochrome c553
MFRKLIAIWVLVGTMFVPALTRAAGPLELKSVTVDLPDEERMFTGPGADAINNNCLACHSAGMVLDQPALSRETWTAEVNKMITAYKAPRGARRRPRHHRLSDTPPDRQIGQAPRFA